jgi:UDP-sulfoquinovose synthase
MGHLDWRREQINTRLLNDGFLKIGLAPIKLDDGLMLEVTNIARKYRHRIDRTKIPAMSRWR